MPRKELTEADFQCLICNTTTREPYMVHNNIWELAGYEKYAGVIHITCLDIRIKSIRGNGLGIEDFTIAPINDGLRFGYKLGYKLGGKNHE